MYTLAGFGAHSTSRATLAAWRKSWPVSLHWLYTIALCSLAISVLGSAELAFLLLVAGHVAVALVGLLVATLKARQARRIAQREAVRRSQIPRRESYAQDRTIPPLEGARRIVCDPGAAHTPHAGLRLIAELDREDDGSLPESIRVTAEFEGLACQRAGELGAYLDFPWGVRVRHYATDRDASDRPLRLFFQVTPPRSISHV